jgi:predicted nucleic acid-binding protein
VTALLDTNVLARLVTRGHPLHRTAIDAVAALRTGGLTPYLVPQCFYELWVLSTRPVEDNGRGRTPAEVADEFAHLHARFPVLPDTPAVFAEWERLVVTHGVIGKAAHDARFAAAMSAHGVGRLLTFNGRDFRRYPGIEVLDPHRVAVEGLAG